MLDQEKMREILSQNPEDFGALYALCLDFRQAHEYCASFAMAERAIASYEKNPAGGEQNRYFELKRLHMQLMRDHLDALVGVGAQILDERWRPIFHLGRPRELALSVAAENVSLLQNALCAPQLKRLRFLSVTVLSNATEAVISMMNGQFQPLRALSLAFHEMPNVAALCQFFENVHTQFVGVTSFKIQLPRIDNVLAMELRRAFGTLESLTLESFDREGITSAFCEYLADDPRSAALTRLGLVGTSIGDDGLFTLLSSDLLTSLQVLDVRNGILTNNAARVIVAHSLPNLHAIDLRYNQIDPAGIDMLARLPIQCHTASQHVQMYRNL